MAGRNDDEPHAPERGPGRPLKKLDPSESALAALGVELRSLRTRRGLTLHELAKQTGYSTQHLGAVERATVAPSDAVVVACDAALLANARLITMFSAVIREQADNRYGRHAARRSDTRARKKPRTSAPDGDHRIDWERIADARRRPSRATRAVVEDLEEITDRQRRLYHDLTSPEMLANVRAHLALLTTLLDGSQPDHLRHRIASAAAEAAGFAAWLWSDLGDGFRSQADYERATAAVREAGNRSLGAYITGYRGMVATQNASHTKALIHLGEATETAPRSMSAVTRSWLMILYAVALAHTQQAEPAIAAIRRARALLAGAGSAAVDPWMYDFERGGLAAHAGICHLALERPASAALAFEEALQLVPIGCDRRAARIKVGLAAARLEGGDREEALSLAGAALSTFAERGSSAGVRAVGQIRSAFAAVGWLEGAAALDDQARALHSAAP